MLTQQAEEQRLQNTQLAVQVLLDGGKKNSKTEHTVTKTKKRIFLSPAYEFFVCALVNDECE